MGIIKIFSDDDDEEIEMPRRIRLTIESMEYDYKTGLLKPETAEWIKPLAATHEFVIILYHYNYIRDLEMQIYLCIILINCFIIIFHSIKYRPYRALPTVRNNHTRISPITDKMFMQFDRTYDGEDAGQTMVPLIDAQDFEALPNMPMSGIGLHHRGIYKPSDDDYSGFLGFHGYTYEIGKFLSDSYKQYAESEGIQLDKNDDSDKPEQNDEYTDSGSDDEY